MIFIDWLSVKQQFNPNDYPFLGSEIITSVDVFTGEILYQTVKGYRHPGSFDSSLSIKFEDGLLTMSGNPSHWCKIDNLFGCSSVQDAIGVFNSVLLSLGYPEFYDDESTYITAHPYAHSPDYQNLGLSLTRVDLTCNYSTDTNATQIIRYLSSMSYRGKPGFLYTNGQTCDWLSDKHGNNHVGSSHIYMKYYSKAHDIEVKLNKLLRQRARLIETVDSDIQCDRAMLTLTENINYLTKLLEFSQLNNIIRYELELKSRKLKSLGLDKVRNWSETIMLQLVDEHTPHTRTKCQFNKKVDLYAQLLALDITPQKARSFSLIGQMWLDGHDVNYIRNPAIKKTTFYVARNALLKLGFDIANQLDIVRFPSNIQTVLLTPLEKPAWYREAA